MAEDDISASDNYEREVDEEAEFKRVQEAALAENALRLSEHASTSGGVETRTPAAANGHVETGEFSRCWVSSASVCVCDHSTNCGFFRPTYGAVELFGWCTVTQHITV